MIALWLGSVAIFAIWAALIYYAVSRVADATHGVMRELHYIRRAMNDHWFGPGSKMWGDEL